MPTSMPTRLPDPCRSRRAGARAGAHAVELARHQPAHVGRPGRSHSRGISASSVMTGAATANPACRRAPTRMERFGRDVLAVLDALGMRRSTGAACRWAAWSANGSAPTRPTASTSSSCPTPPVYYPDKTLWVERLKFVRANGLPALVGANMERWFTKDFRERAPRRDRAHDRDVRQDRCRRLCRLHGGDPRHGPPAALAQDQGADPGDRRPRSIRRPRFPATSSSAITSPAQSSRCSMRRISPTWSCRRPTPTPCSGFC